MTLPSSGAISLLDIQNEYGGTNPIGLNEYYRGGGLVPNTSENTGVPTSGTIQLDDFYGASAGATSYSVDILLMAGSGGVFSDSENGDHAGGSGAGGLYTTTTTITPSTAYTVTIGGGGASFSNGGNTSFTGLSNAVGGGYARASALTFTGNPGGSGGGGGAHGYGSLTPAVPLVPGGTATSGQGNAGGSGTGTVSPYKAGGGGGKGSAGTPGSSQAGGGPGGTGYDLATFKGGSATPVAYGGGGSANGLPLGSPPYVYPGRFDYQTPPPNTGAGVQGEIQGGGKSGTSGILIVRYSGSTQKGSGGTTYTATVGGTTYFFHEFTTSGTFTG